MVVYDLSQIQTGDIVGVIGKRWLSKKIQQFQYLADPESGSVNHLFLIYVDKFGTEWAYEADFLKDFKLKAAVKPKKFQEYLDADVGLILFRPYFPVDEKKFYDCMQKHVGKPYDYKNLLGDQIILKLSQWVGRKIGKPDFEIWLGRNARSTKRLVCHEYVQLVYNEYNGMFPDHKRAKVSAVYHNINFQKITLK